MELKKHCSCSHHDGRCICTEVLVSLNELREENVLCDAVLRLEDGGVFPVHRVILSTCSAYFRNLFTTTLHAHEQTDVLLHGVSSDIMAQILDYVYTRKVDINCGNVRQLLVASDYLCVLGVLQLCCQFLQNTMNLGNCIGIMRLARCHSCAGLESHARRFVSRHFAHLSQQSEELLEMSVEELQAIIGADNLNVKDEKLVWDCILRWIDHDTENRKGHIAELMKNVRLGLLDKAFFLEKIRHHPYVRENESCRPVIYEMLHDSDTILANDGEFLTPRFAIPRIPHDILFVIGGWDSTGENIVNCIETYSTRADRWLKMQENDPTGPRGKHGTAVVGFNIYVIGGYDGVQFLSSVRRFNAVTKTWHEVAPMNDRRSLVSVAVLGGQVYVAGGYTDKGRLKTAERYDYRTNQWSMIASMNTNRSDASATALKDKIYVVGGNSGQQYLASAEVYDPQTNLWTNISPMSATRSGLSCVAYHGRVYAVGGFCSMLCPTSSGEKYDPETDTWTQISEMSNRRGNFAAEVIDDTIFAVGGSIDKNICHVECFDDRRNEWYGVSNMNVHRTALSACVVKDLPNAGDYV
ncbi:kelch-like protein 10 isoform X2 [Zootermopsis nevadensis]|uniref:kelch-like protein 10 isoform X2 n=1 Tax=Zootermopsis nevadensis TaxID=136037 RepID=UPI000B8EA280|nr:kelch-like protein 10 isoform X2 [Zootermopsis nevadensis]